MSDTLRFLALLRDAKGAGVHSHFARYNGAGANISQRSKDLTSKGHQVYKRRENVGHRTGARYWLAGFQPSDAIAVAPNYGDVEVGGGQLACHSTTGAESAGVGTSPQPTTPAADLSVQAFVTVYDYTGTQPTVYLIPVSELGVPKQMALGKAA